jgi:hypothetical protein
MPAHNDVLAAEPPAGVLHHREGLGQNLVERFFQLLVVLDGRATRLPFGGLLAQRIGGQRLESRFDLVDLRDHRPEPFDLAVILRPDDFLDDDSDHALP